MTSHTDDAFGNFLRGKSILVTSGDRFVWQGVHPPRARSS